MGAISVMVAILGIMVLLKSLEGMANFDECHRSTNSDCRMVCKEIPVTQQDENGRNCSGMVKVWGCGGYCLTNSAPHWQFPHKKSSHKVCIHDQLELSEAIIPYCEEGVAEGTNRFIYMKAIGCKCSECNSSVTSCEGMRKRAKPSPPAAVDETNFLIDLLLKPAKMSEKRWQQELIPQILQPPVYP